MANIKTGFSYYSIDTDRYQDIKIKRLKRDFKCIGIAVYDYILSEIYRVRGCFLAWDESTAFDVAEYWGLKETLVNEIVNYCCVVGLFDKAVFTSGSVLTSKSIQSRYADMCARAKRKDFKIPEEYKILPEESGKLPEESGKTPEVCRKVKESKEKESKERENSPAREVFLPVEDLRREFSQDQQWVEKVTLQYRYQYGISPQAVRDYLSKFSAELVLKGEHEKPRKDYPSHFISWLKITLEREKRNGNTQQNTQQQAVVIPRGNRL
jgi:hypothetical protein